MYKNKFSTRELTMIGMLTAVLSVLSILQIPMPSGVPLTLRTCAGILAGVNAISGERYLVRYCSLSGINGCSEKVRTGGSCIINCRYILILPYSSSSSDSRCSYSVSRHSSKPACFFIISREAALFLIG